MGLTSDPALGPRGAGLPGGGRRLSRNRADGPRPAGGARGCRLSTTLAARQSPQEPGGGREGKEGRAVDGPRPSKEPGRPKRRGVPGEHQLPRPPSRSGCGLKSSQEESELRMDFIDFTITFRTNQSEQEPRRRLRPLKVLGLATEPRIRAVFPHEEVDLSAHFKVIDSPARFVGLPPPLLARLLVVPLAFNVVDNPIHSEDSAKKGKKKEASLLKRRDPRREDPRGAQV